MYHDINSIFSDNNRQMGDELKEKPKKTVERLSLQKLQCFLSLTLHICGTLTGAMNAIHPKDVPPFGVAWCWNQTVRHLLVLFCVLCHCENQKSTWNHDYHPRVRTIILSQSHMLTVFVLRGKETAHPLLWVTGNCSSFTFIHETAFTYISISCPCCQVALATSWLYMSSYDWLGCNVNISWPSYDPVIALLAPKDKNIM